MSEETPAQRRIEEFLSGLGGPAVENRSLFDVLRAPEEPPAPQTPTPAPPPPAEPADAPEASASGAEERIRRLEARAEELENTLQAIQKAAAEPRPKPEPPPGPELGALEERLASLETALGAARAGVEEIRGLASGVSGEVSARLEARLAEFARALESRRPDPTLSAHVEKLEAKAAELDQKTETQRRSEETLAAALAAEDAERLKETAALKAEIKRLEESSRAAARAAEALKRGGQELADQERKHYDTLKDASEKRFAALEERLGALVKAHEAQRGREASLSSALQETRKKLEQASDAAARAAQEQSRAREEESQRGRQRHEELQAAQEKRTAALESAVSDLKSHGPARLEARLELLQERMNADFTVRLKAVSQEAQRRLFELDALCLGLPARVASQTESLLAKLRSDWEKKWNVLTQTLEEAGAEKRLDGHIASLQAKAAELERQVKARLDAEEALRTALSAAEQGRLQDTADLKARLQKVSDAAASAARAAEETSRAQREEANVGRELSEQRRLAADKRLEDLEGAAKELRRLSPEIDARLKAQEERLGSALSLRLEEAGQAAQKRFMELESLAVRLQGKAAEIESSCRALKEKEELLESMLAAGEQAQLHETARIKTDLQMIAKDSEVRAASRERDRAAVKAVEDAVRALELKVAGLTEGAAALSRAWESWNASLPERLSQALQPVLKRVDAVEAMGSSLPRQLEAQVQAQLDALSASWESALQDFAQAVEERGADRLFMEQVEGLQAKAAELEEKLEAQRRKADNVEAALALRDEERRKESAALKAKLQLLAQLSEARLAARQRDRDAAKQEAETARSLDKKFEALSGSVAAMQRDIDALRHLLRAGV